MEVIDPGHEYTMDHVNSKGFETITFIKRSGGAVKYNDEHEGTNIQEVLRVLIDRSKYLNNIIPCSETEDAIYHLRMTLFNFESRAYRRKQEVLSRKSNYHSSGHVKKHGSESDIPFTEWEIENRFFDVDGHIAVRAYDK